MTDTTNAVGIASENSFNSSSTNISNPAIAKLAKDASKFPSATSADFRFSLETPSLSSGTLNNYLKSVLGTESATAIPDLLKPNSQTTEESNKTQQSNVSNNQNNQSQPSSQVTIAPSEVLPIVPQQQNQLQQITQNNQLASQQQQQQLAATDQNGHGGEIIPMPRGQAYVDITEYLNMAQSDAAKKLGIPPSTLSKRWKEAVRKRKWPYRMICKIDKEIMTLLHNVPQGPNAPPLPEEIETALGHLLRKRQEELRPVVIRI